MKRSGETPGAGGASFMGATLARAHRPTRGSAPVPPGVLPLAAMKAREMMVATHGHCFDGAASAVLFTRLARAVAAAGEARSFRYKSCGYGPGMQMIPEAWLDGAENAILDFRYTPSKKLSWYFDHH